VEETPRNYWRSNLKLTFEHWNVANTVLGGLGAGVVAVLVLIGTLPRGWELAIPAAIFIALLVWAVLVFLAITPVRMWNESQRTIGQLREELRKERGQNVPDFLGTLEEVTFGETDNPPMQVVIAAVSVVNRGAPSFVGGWQPFVTINGTDQNLSLVKLADQVVLHQDGKEITAFSAADVIYEKHEAVQRGSRLTGILPFKLSGISREVLFQPGNAIGVSFVDFLGKRYWMKDTFTQAGGRNDPFSYIPGAFRSLPSTGLPQKRSRKAKGK
jgi:hypothetical protein